MITKSSNKSRHASTIGGLGTLATLALAALLVSSISSASFAQQPKGLPASANGHADSVLVVPSLNFPTIQSAIDAAKSGDTVKVLPGTYTEQLFITKSITLLGSGAASTVINEPTELVTDSFGYYWGVHIADDAEVAISGFDFTTPSTLFTPCFTLNACATIGVDGGASLELSSSIVHFTYLFTGLWVGIGSTPSSVPFSTGSASVNGVDFEVPSTAPQSGFPQGYGYAGVWLSGDGSLQISSSRIDVIATVGGDTFGIFLDTGTTASILDNSIVGANPIVTSPDMRADISFNTIMPTGLTLFGPNYGGTTAGIAIGQGSKVDITYNNIIGGPNVLVGIDLTANDVSTDPTIADVSHNTISNFLCNELSDAPTGYCGPSLPDQTQNNGIIVFGANGPFQSTPNQIAITDNYIRDTDNGIAMAGSTNCCVVSGNVIKDSTYYALEGRNGNFVFSNNVIIGAQYAVTAVGKATNVNILMVGNLIIGLTIAPDLLQEANGHTATVVFEK